MIYLHCCSSFRSLNEVVEENDGTIRLPLRIHGCHYSPHYLLKCYRNNSQGPTQSIARLILILAINDLPIVIWLGAIVSLSNPHSKLVRPHQKIIAKCCAILPAIASISLASVIACAARL